MARGWRERRRQRRAISGAIDVYERDVAQGEARSVRRAEWLRLQMVEIEAAPIDLYFQGVLCSALAAAADVFLRLESNVFEEGEDDSRALLQPLFDGLDDDDSAWARAVEALHWAFVCNFCAVNWLSNYDEVIALAATALGAPSDDATIFIEVANFDDDVAEGEDEMSPSQRFMLAMARRAYRATLDEEPPADVLIELYGWWPQAFADANDFFHEQLHRYFPDGPPQD